MRHPFKRTRTLPAAVGALLLVNVFSLALSQEASASPMTFSVSGTGAVASGIPAISNSPFWWIDSTGGVSGAAVDPFGFDVFQGAGVNGIPSGVTGSLLTSSLFSLSDGETLNVALTLLTPFSDNWGGLGFAVLLEDSTVKAILANSRPDGIGHFGDLAHPKDVDFNQPGPDVGFKAKSGAIDSNFQLGGFQYGPSGLIGSCQFNVCETNIFASIAPGAGNYQLLFGTFGTTNALAVTDVSTAVPEPATLVLLGLPVAFHFVRRRRA